MAEPNAAPDINPLDQFNSELPAGAPAPAKAPEPEVNPLAKFNSERPHDEPAPTTATGAFLRSAERGVLPAVGSLPAIGAGAELGAAVGAVAGPPGAVVGGLLGGLGGALLGSTAISKAQDYGLSKLPDSWREAIGLDERQEKLDAGEHPVASFLGGIAPFALTMRPGGFAKGAPLPENATSLQRIMAHPATARIFGGAAMGGIELGQEAVEGEHPDWTKVAISTGFGLVFNKPTRFGEGLIEAGAGRARRVMGVPSPTVAQADDAQVIGPGVTEDVHQGAHERDPTAAMTAQQAVRDEQAVTGAPVPERNVAETARKHAPEAFALWDDLHSREAMLRQWDRRPDTVPHIAEHLRDTREQIAELAPEIQGAYRRAAETLGAPTVAPAEGAERYPTMAAMLAAQGGEAAPARPPEAAGEAPAAPPPKPVGEQRATIAADVERQLLAAGYEPEWSRATAQIQASRYVARAQRLGLEPEGLYRQSAPAFARGRAAPPPPATPGAPAPPRPPTPAIDATHDVVSGANSSKELGGPVYIDKHIPELSPALKDRNGQPANLHKYLVVHETEEAQAMREGLSYDAAHIRATAAERTAVEADGVDWKAYTEEMDGFLDHIEYEKPQNPPPAGTLHVKSEDAIGHHRGANKQHEAAPKPPETPAAAAEVSAPPRPEAPAGAAEEVPQPRRGPSAQPEEKRSLLPFIAGRGGIRADDPMINDLRAEMGVEKNHFVPGHGQLIRPYAQVSTAARRGGRQPPMTIDTARELAVDSGYLPQDATINDFLKALDEDRNRRKVYRLGTGAAERQAEPGEIQKAKDDLLADIDDLVKADGGSPLTRAEHERAVELWGKEGLNEAPEILERLYLEARDDAIDAAATHGEEPVAIPGWDDVADTGAAPRTGGMVSPVPGAEGAAGGATRGAGGEGAGTAAAADEHEHEYFQRRRTARDLIAEREAEGQMGLPGTDRITQAELVQRKANEPLKPSVEQKPMDVGLFGDAAKQKELFQQAPAYYSMVARTIEGAKQEKASPDQWLAFLKNTPGVKAEEMEWLGLPDWLKEQTGPVTKQEIGDYVRANAIEVKEVQHGERSAVGPDAQALAEHKEEWDRLVEQIRPLHEKELQHDLTEADLPAGMTIEETPPGSRMKYRLLVNGDPTTFANNKQGMIRSGVEEQRRRLESQLDRLHDRSVNETIQRQGGIAGPAKYGSYTLPGGENYRELLLTLPQQKGAVEVIGDNMSGWGVRYPTGQEFGNYSTRGQAERVAQSISQRDYGTPQEFKSAHWDEPNVLAHVRFDDRVVDGKRTLHVAEVQSDWHQAGRKKGYIAGDENRLRAVIGELEAKYGRSIIEIRQGEQTPGIRADVARVDELSRLAGEDRFSARVPDAPFKTTWPELTLKRMIRFAAERGYDRLSWDTGETNAERYDLSKRISRVAYVNGTLSAWDHDGRQVMAQSDVKPEKLPDYIGKEAADKLLATEPKKPPHLADVERKNLTIEQDEHQYIVRNEDGREVAIGKGTVDSEDEARDYATRYLNKKANEINLARVNEYGRIGPTHELTGVDLKVGGEGMRAFYDKMLPAAAAKLVKKYGAKVEDSKIRSSVLEQSEIEKLSHMSPDEQEKWLAKEGYSLTSVHAIDITPALRDAAVSQGFPMFQTRMGKVTFREGQRPVITLFKHADASTAIHELGHTWLEELMDDAEHPNAGADLKTDAQAVLGWLKVENADAIKTQHHEKFARGFEQYMREGVAPSPELASVFAKFRDWLLQIYKTVRDLIPRPEKEINADIRAVFDRLLAAEPQHTVIAPEVAKRPTLQDIHESDARETEPHEAEPVMDRVVAEADRQEVEPPPGTENEIAAAEAERAAAAANEPAGEAGAGAAEAGEVSGAGERPEPVAPGGPVGAEPGPQLPGGGAIGAKGEPVSGAERPGAAADLGAGLGDKPLASRPSPVFGAAESPFIDRAGNIRLDTLTTREDVRDAIRTAAKENQDFIGDRRGVITDGQVMDLAADIGMVGAEAMLKQRLTGQAFNAEQITAARKLLIQSATETSAAMKKAASGTDEDVMAYAQAKDRHQLIQAQIAGITAEAGRALRAFRDITGTEEAKNLDLFIRQATGKTLFQLRREAQLGAQLDTPQQVSKFMQDAQKRTFGRMLLEYWINGLISGPATHFTYAIGNNILALQKAGPETAAAALVGSIRKAMGREGDTVRIGEVAAQLKAGARGFAPAMKAGFDAFRTGVTTALPGEHETNLLPFQEHAPLGQPAAMDEAANLHDAFTAAFGIMRGVRDGFRAGGGIAAEAPLFGLRYSHLGVIPDIEFRGMNVAPIGTVIRGPGRFIAAIHSFYRATNYSMDKAAIAYRTAANEGLTGHAFDARVGDLTQNPPEAMMDQARGVATELTLMGQGGEFTKALSRLTNAPIFGFPVFKFIDPFVKISSAIIEQALVERTPLGILSPEIRADLMGKNGNVAQDTATARMLVGSAYALAIGSLAAEGYISGSGPSDPRQAAIWRLAGNQAHSVRVGDIWYDVHRLGPMGMLMGVAADLYEVAHKASEGDMLTAAATLQHAITQNILDESFMRGPSDLIKAVDDPGRYGEAYIRNMLSSFVPYSVGMAQMARASDPYSRQARSVLDAMKAKIPGLSESLLPRRDIWGEPMPSRGAFLAPGVTAIYMQRMSHDPVNIALNDLGLHPGAVERRIRGVQLTDDQYDDFARISGRMTKMRLDAIAHSPDFRSWPNHIKRDVISEVIKQSREAARGMIMMRYPSIVRDATLARLKRLQD